MILSVIIVNYNVKYFLEQCLESVFMSDCTLEGAAGSEGYFDLEVFVVDNASVDGSVEMVRQKFPQVHLIANSDNPGFATANNQALRICKGDIMLLLNPDTVVERDTLRKCVDFYLTHPDCGGLTVKMINGEGKFLKESKRGFPTPAASFFKISGLIRLFPHHPRIAAYYMGHLSDNETNPIDILPGAFLMISREALDKTGLLDETYFMYGEDIDFSWRIKLAGFENYYFPETRIIHYKGECTKHGSMNYVYTFYNAMSIFVNHYFTGSGARFFNGLLHLAIWGRAVLAWIKRIGQAVALPLADFALAFGGFLGIKYFWASTWASNIDYYPPQYTWLVIPLYILILMLCSWLNGGYDKPVRLTRIVKGMAIGTATLLVFYSLLDESMRYSRALLLLGCAWTLLSALAIRGLLSLCKVRGYDLRPQRCKSCIIVGGEEEALRVQQLYQSLGNVRSELLHDAHPSPAKLADAIHCYKADEILFCSKDTPIEQIIDTMTQLCRHFGSRAVDYKIVPSDSDFIIGSNSIHSAEDLYAEELRTIATPMNRRNKRLFDFFSALLLLLFSPLLLWFQASKRHYYPRCWRVLTGRNTWVGTDSHAYFGPEDAIPGRSEHLSEEVKRRLRLRYLRNYRITTDIHILYKNLFRI